MDEYNFYVLLGVSQSATKEEILKKYKELAAIYHPDKAGGSGLLFKTINHAKDILLDPRKRAIHDRNIKDNFGRFPKSNNSTNKTLDDLLSENRQLTNQLTKLKVEFDKLNKGYSFLKTEKDNILNQNEVLKLRVDNLSYVRLKNEKLKAENALLRSQINKPIQHNSDYVITNDLLDKNRELKDVIHKLEMTNNDLTSKIQILEKQKARKLTSAGFALILVSVLIFAVGLVWFMSDQKNAGIAALITSAILFFIGYRGK